MNHTANNRPAQLFRALHASFNVDPASGDTNIHAANLSAELAHHPKGAAVCLLEPTVIPRYFGVVCLLEFFGVRVQKRVLGDGVMVFLGRCGEPEMPKWVDSRVMWERLPEDADATSSKHHPRFVLLDEVA